jgi:rubrerythrin
MISRTHAIPLLMRLSANVAWQGQRRIATKLHGFAMTEAGSAHDMFRAAELTRDPHARRLYLRHALDEARHSRRFSSAARSLDAAARPRRDERRHALPQDLYRRLGDERFLAFVHLSEAQALRQFAALADHFGRRAARGAPHADELTRLFSEIAREERYHVAYSGHLLGLLFSEDERAVRVKRALARERRALAWAAYKRMGVRFGARLAVLLMGVVFVLAMPPFALVMRLLRRGLPKPAWHPVSSSKSDLDDARRQS